MITRMRAVLVGLMFLLCIGIAAVAGSGQESRQAGQSRDLRKSRELGPRGPRNDHREPALLQDTRIRLAIGKPLGTMKPLLGINAGPIPSGEPGNADLTGQYRWAGVREVRTQDFYGPLDLSVMYPDLSADPELASSYDFASSDKAFAAIVNAGIEPYLRLGDSYNNVHVPGGSRELENYSRAAVKVVQHYRQGAMNGFQEKFRYLEIGNEPDNKRFWPTRYEEFFPFFVNVFRELKRLMPDLRIGGPGFVVASYKIPAQRQNVARFLDYLKRQGVCLDFISFHLYSDDPGEYYDMVQFYRQEAKKYGMEKAELHVSEWNTEKGGLEVRVGRKAAPYVTACWMALQEAGADASFLFRGTDTNIDNPGFYGIFFADGKKKPAAQAFHLWSRMARFPVRLEVRTGEKLLDAPPADLSGPLKPLWILAGRDRDNNIGILLANIGSQQITCDLALPWPVGLIEITALDSPDGELITRQHGKENSPLVIEPMSVQFVSVQARH